MTEDAELLRRYAEEKSEAAFAELVQRHLNFVYAGALRRVGGDAQLAEDVTQQVFTALARAAAPLSRRPVLAGWLYTTTRFASAQVVRTERRRLFREQEAHIMNELSADSPPPADWERLRPVLDDTMDELDDRDREAVLLRFFEGRSFADVGGRLRLTENAARMRVERALDKMHGLLARRGVTSTTAALALALASQAGVAAPAGLGVNVTATALASATAASGGAVLATKLLFFMSTTKTIAGVAGALAMLATATTVYELNAARDARTALAAAYAQQNDLRSRLHDLEGRLLAEGKRAQAAEDDNAKLLKAIEATAPARAAAVAAASAPITHDMVEARYRHAQELARAGNWEAALPDLLWCYDEGMVRVVGYTGVRVSFLLSELGKLAQNYPPALAALQERRDKAQQRMEGNGSDYQAARDYSSINHWLGDDAATLKYFDALSATDPRRPGLAGLSVYGLLVDAQRYSDAALARPYDQMVSFFNRTSADISQRLPTSGVSNEAASSLRRSTFDYAAKDLEVLAGASDLVHAREFAEKLLAFDGSVEARQVLQRYLTRAGHPELLTGAPKP